MITGTYNLEANPSWLLLQLQEVRLECDTTVGPVTINLPAISTLSQSTNLKLIIVDATGNAATNNITINSGSVGAPPVFDTFDDNSTNQIILNVDGSSIVLQNVAKTQWIATESVGGGGAGQEDITYANLYTKVVGNQLVPGKTYRLTDYKSVNFLNGYQIAFQDANYNGNPSGNVSFQPRAIYTGNSEVLLLTAISNSELSPVGYSESFPQDIIEYQPLTNKIGVLTTIQNGGSLPNGNPIAGFDLQWDAVNNEAYFNMPTGYPALYGQVFSLYAFFDDGLGNKYDQNAYYLTTQNVTSPEIGFTSDNPILQNPKETSRILLKNGGQRVVLVDLTQNDVNAYQSGTLTVSTVFQIGGAFGQITKRTDTLRNVTAPLDFRGRVYRRFEQNLPFGLTIYSGQGDDFGGFGTTGNFEDFNVFENATNLIWTGLGFGFDSIGDNDNNVFFGYVSDVKIDNGFANNSMGVGNGNPQVPVVENSSIGNYFRYNTFGSGFIDNVISSGCEGNFAGDTFEVNTIARNFKFNIISNGFRRNTFLADTQGTNYLAATHVYAGYTCIINRSPDNNKWLTYTDNTGTTISPAVAPNT